MVNLLLVKLFVRNIEFEHLPIVSIILFGF